MKRIGFSLLILACGDDGSGDATSSTGDVSTSTAMSTGGESTTTGTTGSGSTSTGMAQSEGEASSGGAGVDVVSCVALPNEMAEMECAGAFAIRLCVGDGVCEFTNGCECAAGEAQVELRTEPDVPNIEIRSVGEWTIPECDGQEPIDAMGTGCTNLPADTALAFPLDDGVGNQVLLEVRKNGSESGVWRLLSFMPQ